MPSRLVPHHGIEEGQQLVHGGDERHFLGLASLEQPLVESLDHRVYARSGQGRHVEGLTHLSPPASDGAAAAELVAVPIQGRDAHEGRQLAVRQPAQLGQFREEHPRRHRAQPRHTGELLPLPAASLGPW